MVLNEKSLALPVVDGRTGDILGHRTIPLFHKPEYSLAFLVVCADTDDYGDGRQYLVRYSDIQYVNEKHAIAVRKCVDEIQSVSLSQEEYAELIGLPAYYEDGTELGYLTEVRFDPETGILDTATITSGTGRKEIMRRQILTSDSFSVYIKRERVKAAVPAPSGKLWLPQYMGAPEGSEMREAYVPDDALLYEEAQPEDKSEDESAAPTMGRLHDILRKMENENVGEQEEAAAESKAEDDMPSFELVQPEEESVYSAGQELLLSFAGEEHTEKEESPAEEQDAAEEVVFDSFELSESAEPDFENKPEAYKEEQGAAEDAVPELTASVEDDPVPADTAAEEPVVFAEEEPMETLIVLPEEDKTLYPAMTEEKAEKPAVNAGPVPLYAQVFPDDEIEEQPQAKETEKKKSEKSGKEPGKKKTRVKVKSFWRSSISQIIGMCLLGGVYFLMRFFDIV